MSVFHLRRSVALPHPDTTLTEVPPPGAVPVSDAQAQPGREPIPWRAVVLQAGAMWLASRVAMTIFTYFAVQLNAQGTNVRPNIHSLGPSKMLDAWNQWDVHWYTGIAVHGYHDWHAAAFFPFYPLMVHLLTFFMGTSHVLGAAMIVSNLGTLVAFIAIGALAAWEFGPGASAWAVRAAAAYPFMFFTFAGYSDSWLLAWAALTLLFARRRMWPWAAACAFMASISRPTSMVLFVPLLWEYGRALRTEGRLTRATLTPRKVIEALPVVAAVPLGFGVYGLYLWSKFRNPLEWVSAQNSWDHKTVTPWHWVDMAWHSVHNTPVYTFPQARVLMDLAPVVLIALLTIWGVRRMPVSFALYMAAVIGLLVTAAVPADFDPFNAESRYLIMSIPIFLLLGRWMQKRPAIDLLIVASGFLLQGAFAMFWLRGGWIV
ncbi:MAG: hypothetical protein PVSMB7_25030 [Chloroflexota bacterium]